jgi:hypothetical protein
MRGSGHIGLGAASLDEAKAQLAEKRLQIAIVDEDFDGPGVGWVLAEYIREHVLVRVKVIVLVRQHPHQYFGSEEFAGKFDWIMGFPISEEQLLHELNRKWPTTN